MNHARRYRWEAVECLLAAKNCDPHYRNLTTAIAASWHALARQAEATDELIESWNKEDSAAFAAATPRRILYAARRPLPKWRSLSRISGDEAQFGQDGQLVCDDRSML
jgi:hypothetical protein